MSSHSKTGSLYPSNGQSHFPAPEQHTVLLVKQRLNPGVTNTIIRAGHVAYIGNDGTSGLVAERSAFERAANTKIKGGFFGVNAMEAAEEYMVHQAELRKAQLASEHISKMRELESKWLEMAKLQAEQMKQSGSNAIGKNAYQPVHAHSQPKGRSAVNQ
ncbi:hypothetical protein D9619_010872 [Psilocybe cf. subviscida]|uniref:Uncharacterized protein n=1 Tax=Psilocybe cf. subviscida TaxID=2480587 RepID=A0A8H5BAS0_9AGAR|nr:hypothetical protein D9619_010872 [Psilocybe cf. subviscida]